MSTVLSVGSHFPNHPGNRSERYRPDRATLEAFIAYRPEKKSITDLKIALMLIPDYFMIDRDIRVSVRASGSDEWTVLSMNMSDRRKFRMRRILRSSWQNLRRPRRFRRILLR